MDKNPNEEIKSITAGSIILWIIGVFTTIGGIASGNLAIILAGIILLPITTKLAQKYFKIKLSNGARFTIAIILIVIGSIVSSSIDEARQKVEESNIEQTTSQQEIQKVFDVPSLIGKNLSELETILGVPNYNDAPPATYVKMSDIRTWEKTWNKDGYSLMVTYNIDTNKVIELFLGSDSDASLVTFRNTVNILKV
jgi:hypothetical protein